MARISRQEPIGAVIVHRAMVLTSPRATEEIMQIRKEIARLQSQTARRKLSPIQDESERLKIVQEAYRDGMRDGELCELYLSLLPEQQREEAEQFWAELNTSITPREERAETASNSTDPVADASNIDELAARARKIAARREVAEDHAAEHGEIRSGLLTEV